MYKVNSNDDDKPLYQLQIFVVRRGRWMGVKFFSSLFSAKKKMQSYIDCGCDARVARVEIFNAGIECSGAGKPQDM